MHSSPRTIRLAIFGVVAMLATVLGTVVAPAGAQDEPTRKCLGLPATIIATRAGRIVGTAGDDVIIGSPGNDIILGRGGNDTICALSGRDRVLGGSGKDFIDGGRDRDILRGGPGRDTLLGRHGRDVLTGGGESDRLFGANGKDLIDGGAANDVVSGGRNDDILIGGNGRVDVIDGGLGSDACFDRQSGTIYTNCEGGSVPADFELTILHMNDHHSHLNTDSGDLTLNRKDTRVQLGGFPSAVAKIKELEAAHSGDNVVKVHAGDSITGTLFYSLFKGEADAAMLNQACFDVFELGNHEFDDSDAGLMSYLDFLNADPDCDTAVLGANVVPEIGTPLAPNTANDYIDPFVVIDYGGQDAVGYVGLDIANKTKNSSSPLDTTQFLDEVETAQANIDTLTEAGVDKIVLVTHIQLDNDRSLASMVSGVDVIVGGDSHSLLGDFGRFGLNTNGDYPESVQDADGKPVCIVHAWQYSWVVGELNVEFNSDGDVLSCNGTPHLLLADSFQRSPGPDQDRVELRGNDRRRVIRDIEASPNLSIVTPDPEAAAVLEQYNEQVAVLEQSVIGNATEDLCLERIPGQGRSQICDVSDTAQNGGDIQQLVTEAFRVRSFESDIAIQNAGGVRIDIPMGDITIADAFELLPFANTIVNLEMTGAEIIAVLEDAADFAIQPDGSTGAYPYAAGLRWDVDLTQVKGSRFTNLEVKPNGATQWTPFDVNATYTVATNSFVAGGGDSYSTFEDVVADGRSVDTLLDYAQSFIDYIEQDRGGTLTKLPVDEYSTQNFTGLPDDGA